MTKFIDWVQTTWNERASVKYKNAILNFDATKAAKQITNVVRQFSALSSKDQEHMDKSASAAKAMSQGFAVLSQAIRAIDSGNRDEARKKMCEALNYFSLVSNVCGNNSLTDAVLRWH